MLSDDAYRALEEAVGAENVTREPALLDSYAWQPFLNMSTELWTTRPVAVVLPGSTEEVQQVVLACREHGLKCKAHSTGWGAQNAPTAEDVVQLDLRRMNRILEIDEKNMLAVVEPYVCGGELQAEVWKRGLNTHIVGAGPHASPLAGATSMHGCGNDSIYMSTSSRNLLGVEWVLPSGEIVRLGTLGSQGEWYCGDGPGPSLRGTVRGTSGAFGGLGIFTKAAIKLYNWPGPAHIPTEGILLDSRGELPACLKLFNCSFPTEDECRDAIYRIGEAEIGYLFTRMVASEMILLLLPHLYQKLVKRGTAILDLLNKLQPHPFVILLAGSSEDELAYQVEVLHEIVRSARGVATDLSMVGPAQGLMGMNLLRCTIFPTVFRSGNMFATNLDGNEAMDSQDDWTHAMQVPKAGYIEEGKLIADGGENPYIVHYENNLFGHCETIYFYDQREAAHLEVLEELAFDTALAAAEQCNVPLAAFEPMARGILSPLAGDFNEWQKKISLAFDPGGVSDTGFYTGVREPDPARLPPAKMTHLRDIIARFTRP